MNKPYIKTDYIDDYGYQYLDVWESEDAYNNEEEGCPVAFVDRKTAEITWQYTKYQVNPYIILALAEIIKEILN